MDKEIPQESNDQYSTYQQNVYRFFNEFCKSISQYQQSMTNLQLEWIKSCGIMVNPALASNQNFENKSTIITPSTPPKMTSPVQQTKIEEKIMIANKHIIQNKSPSEPPPLQSSSIISSEEIRHQNQHQRRQENSTQKHSGKMSMSQAWEITKNCESSR